MGRGTHNREQLQVKSVRLGEMDINALKVYMDAEEVPQSTALRDLIQYGIQYYAMYVADEKE